MAPAWCDNVRISALAHHAGAALVLACVSFQAPALLGAQDSVPPSARRAVYLDDQGVIRWRDDRTEVRLFGANYILPSASDYRAAGYLGADRKKMIDDDMAHFARMGWDGMRLTLWGDWENSDRAGNLIINDHLDLFDYLIARARERGIYMLLSPIQTYNANWPDALRDTSPPGFSNRFSRGELGTSPAAIAAQVNYLEQLLNHVNRYTGVAIKDEPAILFIELVNEPWHHPEDRAGSVRYINALVDAIRRTGCDKMLFYNVSQDFRIFDAIRSSKVQGLTFGWYPTGLNSGHELEGNYLRAVDAYTPLQSKEGVRLPRIVYEFDTADLRSGYMYPAMARAFRAAGAQFAAMFAYDMLATASRNLGWQTHYLNLAYTPRKAMSAIIAAEAMRRLPRLRSYGGYPENTRFGDFRVSYPENLGELAADDAYLYTGPTDTPPPHAERLRRIAGVGSSPIVQYEGTGLYFLDKLRDGVWRLEVYPDAVPVRDPFAPPNRNVIVTRAISRSLPIRILLPDLGPKFTMHSLGDETADERAVDGRIVVRPGVYLLSAAATVDLKSLPGVVAGLRLDEFHPPRFDTMSVEVVNGSAELQSTSRPIVIAARVIDSTPATGVRVALRPIGTDYFRWWPMRRQDGYEYRVAIPADSLPEGRYEYAIVVSRGDSVTTFPSRMHTFPGSWDYRAENHWPLTVVTPTTPLPLLRPVRDASRLAFTRIGDSGRRGIFRTLTSPQTGAPTLHLELPVVNGRGLPDYTASLVIKDRLTARSADLTRAAGVRVRLRGLGEHQELHITLVESDGTSWSSVIAADSAWREYTLPLDSFRITRGVLLPEGFPGDWNYWVAPASGRGGPNDHLRVPAIERLQLSLRDQAGSTLAPGKYGIEVESVLLTFR